MYRFDFAARVDRGLTRETNQDVARVVVSSALVLVADGMGGHEQGEVASWVAADTLVTCFQDQGGTGGSTEETERRLVRAFQEASARVREQPRLGTAARMGTTLVAAAFAHGSAVIANVGDSRCYRVRGGAAECLTDDHSYAAEIRRSGVEQPPEVREALIRWENVLTRCIGAEGEVRVDSRSVCCEPEDRFVLCSDGLWGEVGPDHIGRIVADAADADEACRRLIAAACVSGGMDNIGVVVVRLLA